MADLTSALLGRKKKFHELLAEQSMSTAPTPSWGAALARALQGGIAGMMENREGEVRGGQFDSTYGPQASVQPAQQQPQLATALAGETPQPQSGHMPRGYRNNNPLNIEAGRFTQGQPGFAGSDGRFAKFASMDEGSAAASKLLDVYQNKHGLNTVAGIIGRWAPAGDGNNVSAYAANVSRQLGIDPNAPVPPEMRQQLIAAMAQHENGRPMPKQSLAAALQPQGDGAVLPPNAQPTQGQMPPQMAQPQQRTAPQIPAEVLKRARAAYVRGDEGTADRLLAPYLAPTKYGFQTLPDGTIARTSDSGTLEIVHQAPKPPTYGVIGEDQLGNKRYGWIDPVKQTTSPAEGASPSGAPITIEGPGGKPLTIPPGVDPKEYRKQVTQARADADTGKKTEVQAKDEKFANKMELAEKNISGLEMEGTSLRGRMQEGSPYLPGTGTVGNYLQSSNYQKFKQGRDNFITALLRDESGAAIGTQEFQRYEKELFPQPGDGAEVIAQKREARRVAIEGMKKGAGPGYKSPAEATDAAPVKVSSPDEARKLPKGTKIILPDGSPGVVP
jgi:hypothetical protein